MNSKYLKKLDNEIRKTKDENDLFFKLSKNNKEKRKKKLKEDSKIESSKSKIDNEVNLSDSKKSEPNSKNSEKNKNLNINELQQEESEKNNIDLKEIGILNKDENDSKIKIDENTSIDYDNNNNRFFPNLILLNSIHECQCCNKKFNSKNRIPYLLKCNHIFCKKCLEDYFTDEEGIKCPIDGLMGESLNDLKILINKKSRKKNNNKLKHSNNSLEYNYRKTKSYKELIKKKNINLKNNNINVFEQIKNNIISDNSYSQYSNSTNKYNKNYSKTNNKKLLKNNSIKKLLNKNKSFVENNKINISNFNNSRNNINMNIQNSKDEEDENIQNFCSIHPEQRITHFVEDTKELICIHCAFNKLKNNKNIQIKEIPEKCKEYLYDLDTIIQNNQKYAQIIQNSLNDIEENKEKEEKKIIEIYEQILNILINNRNNYLIKIEELYQENTRNMNKKLENFDEIIDLSEKLREDFEVIDIQAPYEFNNLIEAFNKFVREINDKNSSELEIIQYNFSHDEVNKVIRYLNDFSDVKTRRKIFRFDLLKNSKNNFDIEEKNNFNKYNKINIFNNNDFSENDINYYYKSDKNKLKNINLGNLSNNIDINYNPLLNNSNNILRFNFKYEDNNDRGISNIFNNNNLKGNLSSKNIKSNLNKYIASTNMIRDNLYNQVPIINFNNYENLENNYSNNNNKRLQRKNLKESENLEVLNKYKFPIKKIK